MLIRETLTIFATITLLWGGTAMAENEPALVSLANIGVSTNPPGGLTPGQTPQIVLLTFDDSITEGAYGIVQQVLTNHWTPNGNPIKATFFVSLDGWVNYEHVRRLYEAGHEIAIHSMSESTTTNTGLVTWRAEIVGCRKTLSDLAAIPLQDILGFRAPFLAFNNASFQMLAERGLLYDASVIEAPGLLSPNGSHYIWPYTLDNGMLQACVTGSQPTQAFPGIFEIPLWDQLSNGVPVVSTDPPESYSSNTVVSLWKTNFLMHYTGNRAPFELALHAAYTNQWLGNPDQPWRVQALNEFLSWAQTHSNVWMITTRDLVSFMQSPCSIGAAPTSTPFLTFTHTAFPTNDVFTTYFVKVAPLTTCGIRPLVYPNLTNVYFQATAISGGTLAFNIITNGGDNTEITLAVSNNTDTSAINWVALLKVPTNHPVLQTYGNFSVHTNGAWIEITAQPASNGPPLHPGDIQSNATFIIAGTDFQLVTEGLTLYDLEAGRPVISRFQARSNNQWAVDWNDSAFGYRMECSTNLFATNWITLNDIYGSTAWTGTVSISKSAYLRVSGIP